VISYPSEVTTVLPAWDARVALASIAIVIIPLLNIFIASKNALFY